MRRTTALTSCSCRPCTTPLTPVRVMESPVELEWAVVSVTRTNPASQVARSASPSAAPSVSHRSMTHGPDYNLLPLGSILDRVDDPVVANPGRPSAPESTQQRRPGSSRLQAQSVNRVCYRLLYRVG